MSETKTLPVEKSEILFLYETTYSIPNGDPFTGEQRYDEETKKILVSDVRIKRFIRDYFLENNYEVYVVGDAEFLADEKGSGAARRMIKLREKYKNDDSVKSVNKKGKSEIDNLKLLKKCIDVRLFGGISTEVGEAVNLTGPVQFCLLNPSLNASDLRMHQNTSVFPSKETNERGAIGTTTVVPYALIQIHGWINPYSAVHTGLTETDIQDMFKALWTSINNANTRTKQNQDSILLLRIIYADPNKKLYGADRLIKLNAKKATEEQIRSIDDYDLDFSALKTASQNPVVREIQFYTEIDSIKTALQGDKFKEMKL